MLKNLFGDLALDLTLRNLLRLLSRTTYDNGGNLRVLITPSGTQSVSGTVSVNQPVTINGTVTQGNAILHQQSQLNYNEGFRSRISKT